MKLSQPNENKSRGRPRKTTDEELLRYEGLWVDTFTGLRDGTSEAETVVPARSGMFVKSSGGERERVYSHVPGEAPRVVHEPRFSTTPDEKRRWTLRKQEEEKQFEKTILTPHVDIAPAIPDERSLWEALKRAQTAAQVRRICSRSKIWLRPRRIEFPDGGFVEWWAFRRVLYQRAQEFCRAKLDPRYPGRDQRASGDYRRIEYFARVLSGLTVGLAPSTAVERLRRMRHPGECGCWRCFLGIGSQYGKSLVQLLCERGPAWRI